MSRVLLIGSAGTGKTTWIEWLRTHNFSLRYIPTVGHEVVDVEVNGVKFQILDTAGDPKFGPCLLNHYFLWATSVIIFHDGHRFTVREAKGFIKEVQQICSCPIVVCCAKSDIAQAHRVSPNDILVSAKTGHNVLAPLIQVYQGETL